MREAHLGWGRGSVGREIHGSAFQLRHGHGVSAQTAAGELADDLWPCKHAKRQSGGSWAPLGVRICPTRFLFPRNKPLNKK